PAAAGWPQPAALAEGPLGIIGRRVDDQQGARRRGQVVELAVRADAIAPGGTPPAAVWPAAPGRPPSGPRSCPCVCPCRLPSSASLLSPGAASLEYTTRGSDSRGLRSM